jgi:hypothetical protein
MGEFASRSASFWIASLASLALIVGGVAQWATAFGFMSVNGTDMHGWNEVAVGVLGLTMLGLHRAFGARLPLMVAAVLGAFGAIQAAGTLAKIGANGTMTVFGVQYRYLDPAWGLYLVLAAGIALACSASLAWLASRATSPRS